VRREVILDRELGKLARRIEGLGLKCPPVKAFYRTIHLGLRGKRRDSGGTSKGLSRRPYVCRGQALQIKPHPQLPSCHLM